MFEFMSVQDILVLLGLLGLGIKLFQFYVIKR